ncbi:hypothetical protein ACP4OV_013283 [Aristida adscensionis]
MSNGNITDEQPPVVPASDSGNPFINSGKVKAVVQNKDDLKASFAADTVTVLLDVSATSSAVGRAGLDLVVVLDVSGSMADNGKLDKVKSAMQFLLQKLSPMDRLSIVSFSNAATKLSGLRPMDAENKSAFNKIVVGLAAGGGTNIQAGLEAGLDVLATRKVTAGRTANVLLMSDGQETDGKAREAKNPANVPVYTLGFGKDSDDRLLRDVAKNGGTFNAVPDQGNMVVVFSQLLGGLLTVVVNDLHLILKKSEDQFCELDKIARVDAGSFATEFNGISTEVTVKFGDLFSGETRTVLVDLLLVTTPEGETNGYESFMLDVSLSYIGQNGNRVPPEPEETISVRRDPAAPAGGSNGGRKLQLELARRQHAQFIGSARSAADQKQLDDARDTLVDGQNALEDILDQGNPIVPMLKAELKRLLDLMESPELYEAQGRGYALAAEASHAAQRFAARGDDVDSVRLYATARMDAYLEQAKQFTQDPSVKLPDASQDTKQEVKANPVAAIAGPLGFYIQAAIKALQAIENIVTTAAANPPSA